MATIVLQNGSGPLVPAHVTVIRYSQIPRGAYLALLCPGGLIINDIFYDPGSNRIGLPSRAYPKRDGGTGYAPIIDFQNPEARRAFDQEILAAIDLFRGQNTRG